MKRRSFLAAIGISPVVAGSTLAGVKGGYDLGMMGNATATAMPDYGGYTNKITDSREWVAKRIAGIRDEILGLTRESAAFQNAMRNVSSLDADLQSNRSLSLSARVRLQAERNIQRTIDERKGHLQSELNSLLGTKP